MESSVRRYEKHARVTARLHELSLEIMPFVEDCDSHVENYLTGGWLLSRVPAVLLGKRMRC